MSAATTTARRTGGNPLAESPGGWTTASEIAFIRELGRHTGGRPSPAERIPLFEGYLVGAELRGDWGAIDSAPAIATARAMVEELKRGAA